MSDLNAKKRSKIATSKFGLPEKAKTTAAKKESGNYPMPDKAHARNAKSQAAQQHEKGNRSKSQSRRNCRHAARARSRRLRRAMKPAASMVSPSAWAARYGRPDRRKRSAWRSRSSRDVPCLVMTIKRRV